MIPLRRCRHCGTAYDWRKSPSGSLKMTYCGSLCERADLGFTIEALLEIKRDMLRSYALEEGSK